MSQKSHENNLNKDVLKYLFVKILPAISGLLTIYFLTRTLSISLYSNYAFITATILLFGQLISGWINSSVLFFYPDYLSHNSLDALKINVITLQAILYIIGGIGFFFVCYFGLKNFGLIIIGLLLLLSQTFLNLLYSFLQAERRVGVQIKSTLIQSVIQITGVLFCYFYSKENLYDVIIVFFLSYFIACNYVMYSDKIYRLLFSFSVFSFIDISIAKRVLVYGFPICVWFFASQFYTIGDRILFQYFNVNKLVANYASFRDLSVGLSGFITMPLLMASHPIIIQMSKDNTAKVEIEGLLVQNIKLLITLFTPVFIGILLIGDWLLAQVVEGKYLLDNDLMILVLLSIFFGTISMYLHKGLETKGRTILMTKIALLVGLLSLILNVFLIPIYGVKAACIVSVLCQVIYCVTAYYFSKEIFKIKIPYVFLFQSGLYIVFAFIVSRYGLDKDLYLIPRMLIFVILTVVILLSSKEIKSMLKLINK
ncbi:MAG: polysaccharide biosynthesis C-terminal domain-containing protein [Flavobacterium sp.]|uniref:oligosaccharide flippase family protein n=1 Tax=Flavobacterium sp. TaxID=239 RepID=UPI003267DD99